MPESDTLSQDAPKKITIPLMFAERMKREGRYRAFQDEIKRLKAETGKGFNHVKWAAMRNMGYTTADRERELLAEHERTLHKTSMEKEREKIQAEIKEEQKIASFDEVVRSLPDSSSHAKEINWVRAHPAMVKKNRQKDKSKEVEITAEDVLCPPHGPAPSKAAVYMLQHWANNPNEFFKQVLSEHKKVSGEDEEGGKGVADVGLAEVERLLKEVKDGLSAAREGEGERRRDPDPADADPPVRDAPVMPPQPSHDGSAPGPAGIES